MLAVAVHAMGGIMQPGLAVAVLLSLPGCGGEEDAPGAWQHIDPIVGGVADDGGLPEVVALRLNFRHPDGGLEFRRCSGTLITPTVAVTAAHCTSAPLLPGSTLVAMEVQNLSPAAACTGLPGEATRCLTTCVDFNDCSTREVCEPGQGGVRLCVPAPHTLDELSVEESKAAAAGCSTNAAAPGPLALAAQLLLTRRRRR